MRARRLLGDQQKRQLQMFSVAKAKRQLQMFSVAKAKRQLQMFSVAKAKRQLQSAQPERKSTLVLMMTPIKTYRIT
ncbi:hypothetical protein PVA17_05295 [Lysinibacillus sp. CNPSo 3705]|uniref:hypothetical protein n=1 Tax=Lysinibacillus sp. CNPSo 3705 TaxID=3028148 RepID=UPI002363BCB5|nr:hypothetical protein [Lysinibacillus sp. CNPSo 3705]MDD1502185.1 hypothetical protein [Lysinibacillus sp. CNPSo 3705]